MFDLIQEFQTLHRFLKLEKKKGPDLLQHAWVFGLPGNSIQSTSKTNPASDRPFGEFSSTGNDETGGHFFFNQNSVQPCLDPASSPLLIYLIAWNTEHTLDTSGSGSRNFEGVY
jgi:hypothetical protein